MNMILIQQDLWRADCIAAIGWDEEKEIQVFPVNCSNYVSYEYDTHEGAAAEYKTVLTEWKFELGKME